MNLLKNQLKWFYKEKGFTLIEVLIAMSILTIIITAYMGLFTNSYVSIFSTGRKSEAIYTAQEKIADSDYTAVDNNPLSIEFGSKTITINGETVVSDEEYDNKKVMITMFIPD